jgi:hypothetical protein
LYHADQLSVEQARALLRIDYDHEKKDYLRDLKEVIAKDGNWASSREGMAVSFRSLAWVYLLTTEPPK